MTGAELKTTREALNLSVVWCSHHFKNKDNNTLSERTWRFWESGGGNIPNEIEIELTQLAYLMNKAIAQGVEQAILLTKKHNIDEIVLYRYKTDSDLWENNQDNTFKNLGLPASYHARILHFVKCDLEDKNIKCKIEFMS